jgi:NADH-quinone oxidoreductase subunit M
MLAWTIYLSFVGAVFVMLSPARWVRVAALAIALLNLVIVLIALVTFDAATTSDLPRPIIDVVWIPQLGIHYHLAADGISVTLALLTAIASVVLFSWNINDRVNEFFALFFVLIGGVKGRELDKKVCQTDVNS